jgi:hypothetical protein
LFSFYTVLNTCKKACAVESHTVSFPLVFKFKRALLFTPTCLQACIITKKTPSRSEASLRTVLIFCPPLRYASQQQQHSNHQEGDDQFCRPNSEDCQPPGRATLIFTLAGHRIAPIWLEVPSPNHLSHQPSHSRPSCLIPAFPLLLEEIKTGKHQLPEADTVVLYFTDG